MRLGVALILLAVVAAFGYFVFGYVRQNGFLDVIVVVFVVMTLLGTFKLLNIARSGNHY